MFHDGWALLWYQSQLSKTNVSISQNWLNKNPFEYLVPPFTKLGRNKKPSKAWQWYLNLPAGKTNTLEQFV